MIGIVGAGITGLALSHYLDEAEVDHLVLEASDRSGGVIRSSRVEGRVLDHGPQRTRVTPAIQRLLEELELTDRTVEVPPGHPLYVYRGGRLRRVPFTATELVRTDLLSWKGKLRMCAEPLTGRWQEDETVGQFLTRKFGREAYESLMGPLFGGLYGSDPEEMYVRHALAPVLDGLGVSRSILRRFVQGRFNRAATPPAVSFDEGMEVLTDALHRSVSGRVRLSTPVQRIVAGSGDGGWTLIVGDDERVEVESVVLTPEAPVAGRLLAEAAPAAAKRLQRLHYNDLIMVHLLGASDLHGLGYQVGYGEPLRTRGVTWNASALGRDGVFTAFLGGARDPEILSLDDGEIGQIAAQEMQRVTGVDTRVLRVGRTRIPSWDRSWAALDGLQLPPGLLLAANYESRVGIPGRINQAHQLAGLLAD